MYFVNQRYGLNINTFKELYNWSVSTSPAEQGIELFWSALWDFANIKAEKKGNKIVNNLENFFAAQWFPEAQLNFAENILKKQNNKIALIFRAENQILKKVTWESLYSSVSKVQQFMLNQGLKEGDRVALFIPNMPEAIVCLLAAASIGAICSFCSPDFGAQGIVDRFGQIEPTLFIYSNTCLYNGKVISNEEKTCEALKKLPSVKQVICIDYLQSKNFKLEDIANASDKKIYSYEDILLNYDAKIILFKSLPFNHPLYIMYSSGTTGIPKCIVHGAGGTLLQHIKEHLFHCNMKPGDKVFYYTTCGWMMWQWLVSALASECTLLLYDGSPFFPGPEILFSYLEEEGASFFGISAKYIDAVRKSGFLPKQKYTLEKLETIGSTGSPLVAESFDFVYENIKKDICLSSLSGGTDIISCFVLGNPIGNVYRGQIQARGLGMKVEVFNENGKSVMLEKGELVCTLAFPSKPLFFGMIKKIKNI